MVQCCFLLGLNFNTMSLTHVADGERLNQCKLQCDICCQIIHEDFLTEEKKSMISCQILQLIGRIYNFFITSK